jgi:hypothetical protein
MGSQKATAPTVIMPAPTAPSLYRSITTPEAFAVGEKYLKSLQDMGATSKASRIAAVGTDKDLRETQEQTKYQAAATYLSSLPKGDKYLAETTGIPKELLYKTATTAASTIADEKQKDYFDAVKNNTTAPVTETGSKLREFNRYYNPSTQQHFYSSEPDKELLGGFNKEGDTAFKTFDPSDTTAGASTLYRLYRPGDKPGGPNHLFTTSKEERDSAIAGGYNYEGDVGKVYQTAQADTQEVQRFYNPEASQHMYTSDLEEIKGLEGKGYKREGSFFTPTKAAAPAPAPATATATATAPATPSADVAAVEKARADLAAKAQAQAAGTTPTPTPAAGTTPTPTPAAGTTPTPTPAAKQFLKDSVGKNQIQEASSDFFAGAPRLNTLSTKGGNDQGIFGTKDYESATASSLPEADRFKDDEIEKWLKEKNVPLGDDIAANKFGGRLAGQVFSQYS